MIDIDSRLDARLQSFYERIEEQRPPRGFETFEAPRNNPRRRALNVVAGTAGIAVVAVGIGLFAAELARHHNVKPPTAAVRSTLPTKAQLTLGLPSISRTVIGLTHGHGSASLPMFTPEGIVFVQEACNGSGSLSVSSLDHKVDITADSCDGSGIGGFSMPVEAGIDGRPITLEVSAAPSVAWEIVVADSGPAAPLPLLGPGTIPAGAHVLVPATTGTGTSGIESFTPTGPYFIQYTCTGTETIDFSTPFTNQTGPFVRAPCANGAVGTEESPKPRSQEVINLTVETPPHNYWEVQVYELPVAKG
jgi:hypothetical protein